MHANLRSRSISQMLSSVSWRWWWPRVRGRESSAGAVIFDVRFLNPNSLSGFKCFISIPLNKYQKWTCSLWYAAKLIIPVDNLHFMGCHPQFSHLRKLECNSLQGRMRSKDVCSCILRGFIEGLPSVRCPKISLPGKLLGSIIPKMSIKPFTRNC